MASAVPPTVCRPQHLDVERLRHLLSAREFESVAYSEPVVVAKPASGNTRSFRLLVLTPEALLLLPLGGGSDASRNDAVTRIPLSDVQNVAHASARLTGEKSLLLHAESELFHVVITRPTVSPRISKRSGLCNTTTTDASSSMTSTTREHVAIATFESTSRAFFHVHRAFTIYFQRELLMLLSRPQGALWARDDLHSRLDALLCALSRCSNLQTRGRLLDELGAAVVGYPLLQRVCLQDQSHLQSVAIVGSTRRGGDWTSLVGLPGFLLFEIQHLSTALKPVSNDLSTSAPSLPQPHDHYEQMQYLRSLLHVLFVLIFGGHMAVPECRSLFHRISGRDWVSMLVSPVLAPTEEDRNEDIDDGDEDNDKGSWRQIQHAMAAQVLEEQVAVLFELLALQEEQDGENLVSSYRPEVSLLRIMVTEMEEAPHSSLEAWTAALVTSVAVLTARSPVMLGESLHSQNDENHKTEASKAGRKDTDTRDTWMRWSLALWRNTTLLQLLLAQASFSLLARLRHQCQDDIDFYLRAPYFIDQLDASTVTHLQDTGAKLRAILALL